MQHYSLSCSHKQSAAQLACKKRRGFRATCVTCLNSVEVQVGAIGAGGNAGGRAAAHANPVGWPAYFDNEHANVRVLLVQVAVINLAQPATAGRKSPSATTHMFGGLTHAGKPTRSDGKVHMQRLLKQALHVNFVPTLSVLNASLSLEMTAASLGCRGMPEHDGLDPFPSLPGGHPQPECARVARNQGLAKLVAIVRCSI